MKEGLRKWTGKHTRFTDDSDDDEGTSSEVAASDSSTAPDALVAQKKASARARAEADQASASIRGNSGSSISWRVW